MAAIGISKNDVQHWYSHAYAPTHIHTHIHTHKPMHTYIRRSGFSKNEFLLIYIYMHTIISIRIHIAPVWSFRKKKKNKFIFTYTYAHIYASKYMFINWFTAKGLVRSFARLRHTHQYGLCNDAKSYLSSTIKYRLWWTLSKQVVLKMVASTSF